MGLDQEPKSSLGISLDGDERGWEEAKGDVWGDLDLKGAPLLKSAWMIFLVLHPIVGLDGGLVEQLLSSSVSDFLLLVKLEESVAVCFWLTAADLVVQSLLPLLTRWTMSLEESTL